MKKKEKHPMFWAFLIVMILLLALGIALLAEGISQGPGRIYSTPVVTL